MSGGVIDIAAAASAFRASLTAPEAGSGPGLVVFRDVSDQDRDLREVSDLYTAEGYVVLCPETFAIANEAEAVTAAVETLRSRSECTGKVGALGFGPGGLLLRLRHRFRAESRPPHRLPAGPAFRRERPADPATRGRADQASLFRLL